MCETVIAEFNDNSDEDTWANVSTGEIRQMKYYIAPKTQSEFLKIYRKEYQKVTEVMVAKELYVLNYIINHLNTGDNKVYATFKKISASCKISMRTVATAMSKLQKIKFIAYEKDGVWIVNPYVIMYGYPKKQREIYAQFIEHMSA